MKLASIFFKASAEHFGKKIQQAYNKKDIINFIKYNLIITYKLNHFFALSS